MGAKDAMPTVPQISARWPNRLGCVVEACDRFVRMRDVAGASDVITLIEFNCNANMVLQSQTLHAELIMDLVHNQRFSSGGTVFHNAFEKALASLRRGGVECLPVLIMFLTDGCDGGDPHRLMAAIECLRLIEDVSLKAIGFGAGCNAPYLQDIARRFGERGEYIGAVDEVQLVGSFEAAAAELSHTGGKKPT